MKEYCISYKNWLRLLLFKSMSGGTKNWYIIIWGVCELFRDDL